MSKAPLRILWILTAVVLLAGIFRLLSTRDSRSPDQKILLQKDKQ